MNQTVRIRPIDKDPETGMDRVFLILERGDIEGVDSGRPFVKRPGWGLVGGRVQPGETPKKAAEREWREETGMRAKISDHYYVIPHGADHEILLFEATDVEGEFNPSEKAIMHSQWVELAFAYGELPHKDNERTNWHPIYKTHLEKFIHRIPDDAELVHENPADD